MNNPAVFRFCRELFLLTIAAFLFSTNASAREKVLHTFESHPASQPFSRLVPDGTGTLYGTTQGPDYLGVVYCLNPNIAHSYRVLYQFKGGEDGSIPGGEVIFDEAGNMYGVTLEGGGSANCQYGCGVVYELSLKNGGWSEQVIYRFQGGQDGAYPPGGLEIDGSGNLYGLTASGGASGDGTAFELQNSGGTWKKTTLYQFSGTDGYSPDGTLIWDAAGNLYGFTDAGGTGGCVAHGCGTIFELSPNAGGWTEKVLYNFQGSPDGEYPRSTLMKDASGNLFGTTFYGGSTACSGGCGIVYELSPGSSGWTETIVHSFTGSDGRYPIAGVVEDSAQNLYGVVWSGGPNQNVEGTYYELSPSNGNWTFTVLHNFNNGPQNNSYGGCWPGGDLWIDSSNNVFGTTAYCGRGKSGVVFEMTP